LLQDETPDVPKPVAFNRSTVLLQELDGVKLSERPELVDPLTTLRRILGCARAAFTKKGLINGDLSEYNVLTDGERVWVIDWPQSVNADHPNADELLGHDVRALLNFFAKAYGVRVGFEESMAYVKGKRKRPPAVKTERASSRG
jgi:RIO kinase 2